MDYSFTIPVTHPSLEGHFPNNPIVPGVVILDEVLTIIKMIKPQFTVHAMPMVKFLQPLLAEQKVFVEIKEKTQTSLSFICSHNETKLVTGQLNLKSLL